MSLKDNFALRDLAATADTRIFVRNPTSSSTAQSGKTMSDPDMGHYFI